MQGDQMGTKVAEEPGSLLYEQRGTPISVAYYVTYLVPSLGTAIFNLCREMEEAGGNINTDFGKHYTSLTGKSQMYFNVHYLILKWGGGHRSSMMLNIFTELKI